MAVFTADPQIVILHGREEVGSVDPMLLQRRVEGPRLITLGGRSWQVNYVDWKRHRAYVEPSDRAADSKWSSMPQPESYALSDATRRVLLGAEPTGVTLSKRAIVKLEELRGEYINRVAADSTVLVREANGRLRWWTWAGARANAVLAAALLEISPKLLDEPRAYNNWQIGLRGDATAGTMGRALRDIRDTLHSAPTRFRPSIDARALKSLKFSELLPLDLAVSATAERAGEPERATDISERPIQAVH
ncbi:hypothetical protein ACX8Z9_01570 [Arthrobacter halodurans]|uniref:Uncharacterized protein n=1 Tax=Arthrobacter halodurans TaxID=516699 RepID=A0ABV4UIH8_9MICC